MDTFAQTKGIAYLKRDVEIHDCHVSKQHVGRCDMLVNRIGQRSPADIVFFPKAHLQLPSGQFQSGLRVVYGSNHIRLACWVSKERLDQLLPRIA